MRVPTLAMYKDYIPAGSQTNQIMSQLDWFPTFARFTNSEFSDKIILDGEDISAVLRGESDNNERDFLFFDYDKLEAYRLGDYKVKLPYEGWPGTWYKSPLDSHDTLLFNLSIDPGEKNNIFESNKELALILIEKMKKKYSSMGDLPPSIIIRTDADESHLDYLNIKK